jgi:hypothetical protein
MSNTIIALDILMASLQVSAKIQEMLLKAQTENRDITEDELQFLKERNDSLEREILNK